ncbi:MAG: hypothetical protein HXY29_14195, partial [Rhodocyclaceae bacterium]|nr:hypothetical protein [Rhodocyclaceae bacterium]
MKILNIQPVNNIMDLIGMHITSLAPVQIRIHLCVALLNSEGKKHFISDFFTHDVYPIDSKGHASLASGRRGVIDIWLENLDHLAWDMAELVPLGTFIETQNVTNFQWRGDDLNQWDAGPPPGDIRTQAWGAVVH